MNISTLLLCAYAVPVLLLIMNLSLAKMSRRKRANIDNFNVLLSIYKMNPLKHSKVFKTFSNSILLPRPDERRPDLNYNSDESSIRNNTDRFKQIEEIIHYAPLQSADPSFDINTLSPYLLTTILTPHSGSKNVYENPNIRGIKLDMKEKSSSREEVKHASGSRRNERLKVYNLNARSEDNKVNYNDAEVVVVK